MTETVVVLEDTSCRMEWGETGKREKGMDSEQDAIAVTTIVTTTIIIYINLYTGIPITSVLVSFASN